jgi:hypothetical protein
MSVGDFQKWLDDMARKRRAQKYETARLAEWYVPLDVRLVSQEAAIAVARFLGELRLRWQREAGK